MIALRQGARREQAAIGGRGIEACPKPGPGASILALLDVLLRRAAVVVEGDHPHAGIHEGEMSVVMLLVEAADERLRAVYTYGTVPAHHPVPDSCALHRWPLPGALPLERPQDDDRIVRDGTGAAVGADGLVIRAQRHPAEGRSVVALRRGRAGCSGKSFGKRSVRLSLCLVVADFGDHAGQHFQDLSGRCVWSQGSGPVLRLSFQAAQ